MPDVEDFERGFEKRVTDTHREDHIGQPVNFVNVIVDVVLDDEGEQNGVDYLGDRGLDGQISLEVGLSGFSLELCQDSDDL